MNTQRLNITIPKEIMDQLKDKPNKSAFIAQAIVEKLRLEVRQKRDAELAQAYRQSAIEDKEIVADWDCATGDGL